LNLKVKEKMKGRTKGASDGGKGDGKGKGRGIEEATKWTRKAQGHTGQRVTRSLCCAPTSLKPVTSLLKVLDTTTSPAAITIST
jgi:hypothetical protein